MLIAGDVDDYIVELTELVSAHATKSSLVFDNSTAKAKVRVFGLCVLFGVVCCLFVWVVGVGCVFGLCCSFWIGRCIGTD